MIIINDNYNDVEKRKIEIVERKGIGHPDTLADILANICSIEFSKYCLKEFGFILHHNFDKLYIGAGRIIYEDSKIIVKDKIKINLNGRCSNKYNKKIIDIKGILEPKIKEFLVNLFEIARVEDYFEININSTQNSKRDNWYMPESKKDLPELDTLLASDTSVCVAQGNMSLLEELALKLEQSLYNYKDNNLPIHKYKELGSDMKFMLVRVEKEISVHICIPVLRKAYNNNEEYDIIINRYKEILNKQAKEIIGDKDYNYKILVNENSSNTYDRYTLILGSCIECGEEGVVGRGNDINGIISVYRENTKEAEAGKNPSYHTGKVIAHIIKKISSRIYKELNIKNTIVAIQKNKNELLNPYLLEVSIEKKNKNIEEQIDKIIKEEFNKDYIFEILKSKKIF